MAPPAAEHARARPGSGASWRGIAGAALSVVLLGAVVWWASRQEAPRLPDSPGALAVLAAAVLVYGTATVGRGWRWHAILRRAGIRHTTFDVYALIPVGYMGNTVLPARGGELLRVFLLADRGGARRREVLGSIVGERLTDAVALLVLFTALTFAGVAGSPLGTRPAVVGIVAVSAAGAGAYGYLALRRRGRFDSFADRMRPVVRAGRPLLGRAGITMLLASLAIWTLEAFVLWLVGRSLSLDIDIFGAAFIAVASAFLSLVPAAPGYVGTYDAAMLFSLDAVGITGGDAVGFTLLSRAVVFVPITLVGLVLLLTRYGGLATVRSQRLEAEADEGA